MKAHYTDAYLLNPTHLVTVALIGVGGTGSQVLSGLARMNEGLQALGHPGLHVRAFDPDIVTEANVGRQLFSPADIGMNKAISSVTRINRFFGLDWEAFPLEFNPNENTANIVISCVDTAKARIKISDVGQWSYLSDPMKRCIYWLDFGNLKVTGQVVLGEPDNPGKAAKVHSRSVKSLTEVKDKKSPRPEGHCRIRTVTELFDLRKIKEKDQGPSCSLAQAIGRQDLFINSTMANLGLNLLWKLFTNGKLEYHGVFLNLETMQVRPIKIE